MTDQINNQADSNQPEGGEQAQDPSSIMYEKLSSFGLTRYVAEPDSQEAVISVDSLASVAKPAHVLVSRHAVGYRTIELTGPASDEGIARVLSLKLNTRASLARFGNVLDSGFALPEIMRDLFPRADVPFKGRASYSVTERRVSAVVDQFLASEDQEVKAAYVYVLCRIFEEKKLITRSEAKSTAMIAKSYLAPMSLLKEASFMDKMRGIFDSASIKRWASKMEDEITPVIMAERLTELFQHIASVLPQVARDIRSFEIALYTLRLHLLRPSELPLQLKGNDDLVQLAKYANLVTHVISTKAEADAEVMTADVYVTERALQSTVKLIAGAESIEVVSIEKFCDAFYAYPAMASKGEARGMVLGRRLGQKSKNVITSAVRESLGWKLVEQDPQDNRGALFAPNVDARLTSSYSFSGVMNIMADALANSLVTDQGKGIKSPELWTFQVSEEELTIMAMRQARTLMILKGGKKGDVHRLVYTVPVRGEWRMHVSSSNGLEASFNEPAAAVLYSYDMDPYEGQALPSREQSLSLAVYQPRWFVNDVKSFLSAKISKPFEFDLAISGQSDALRLSFSAMSEYLAEAAEADGEKSRYFYVREPGVDSEVRNLFGVIAYFMASGNDSLRDKAVSWLIEQISEIMEVHTIQAIATVALKRSAHAAKWDIRRFPSQQREVQARTLLATVLGLLERFEKIRVDDVQTIVTKMPVSTLSAAASAQITRMQMMMAV